MAATRAAELRRLRSVSGAGNRKRERERELTERLRKAGDGLVAAEVVAVAGDRRWP
jgi:hypothetical protein